MTQSFAAAEARELFSSSPSSRINSVSSRYLGVLQLATTTTSNIAVKALVFSGEVGAQPNTYFEGLTMSAYQNDIKAVAALKAAAGSSWSAIDPESVARMRAQNRFKTGLEIAQYTADIMRKDMAEYDADSSVYTQSLGCWHGFIGQQKLISIKKHLKTTNKRYLYLSGWMVAALRSDFGPLPDQSMHEKTSVSGLIEELYTFLRQADARELDLLFTALDAARAAGDNAKAADLQNQIDNYETHVVPIIADIDAGFGNPEATYLLAKKMIEAGACCIQIENQVSDEKQCGHQDGKVTVPHADFLAKINAVRYAFLELGIDNGVIVARTDSLGAGLTKQIAVTNEPGDLGDQYNSFLDCEEVSPADLKNGDVVLNREGKLLRPKRLPSNLFQFRAGTGEARCVLDSITSLQNGADMLWIETEKPHVGQIAEMVNEIRKTIPNAKLVYNNSPSFNWTLNFRQQVFDAFVAEGKDVSAYDRTKLMSVDYDETELAQVADEKIRTFQRDGSAQAGIFHHLITLPTYHTAALSTDNLAKGYFAEQGMLAYVKGVQRQEIRQGIACVKHQNMSGSDIGDAHKEYFAGEAALKAGGKDNTMNQFS
jgi:isocitrate lyase